MRVRIALALAAAVTAASPSTPAHAYSRGDVVAHPEGCPRTKFCGCGAALKVFGRHVRGLWKASSWYQFPRAAAGPGMVAVRSGHVFVILHMIDSTTAHAYDANSGKGRTHVGARSIAGYTIVNPQGYSPGHDATAIKRSHRKKKRRWR